MNRFALLLVAAAVIAAACGCSIPWSYRWREEVLLHDGRLMVVERGVSTGRLPTEIGQSARESDFTLTFRTRDGKSVTWDGGRDSYRPMILDFADDVPHVVALGMTALVYGREGCPRPPYFFFRWRAGQWERIAYEEFPRTIRDRNLSVNPTHEKHMRTAISLGGLVTKDDVRKSYFGVPRQYMAVREDAPNPCATYADPHRYAPKQ